MDKGVFWMPKSSVHASGVDAVLDNSPSKMEPKRARHWFLDPSEADFFPSKKQALQSSNAKPEPDIMIPVSLPWESSSGFSPGPTTQFMDRLFGSETIDSSSMQPDGSNIRTKAEGEHFDNDVDGLSMSYPLVDPTLTYGSLRKVKVSQVNDDASLDQGYHETSESTFDAYCKESENMALMGGLSYEIGGEEEANVRSVGPTFGYQDESAIEALAKPVVGSYSLLYEQQSSSAAQTLEVVPSKKEVVDVPNFDASLSISRAHKSKIESKNKSETKSARKEAPNSFPSNVRSLIATGILDGVPIKYVSVSREELRGIIKGSGYLCGCESCNYSKALNAYEFERHAGCKTKHPNNHIYFENGKTIYQIVQELRSTPESMLFDAILNVTGSPINQNAFRIWKESFQAATRELRRIYGKEELNL
ncbi:acyl-CoA N-acyltransferase [Striga asiatica]|uniref:Acyl-CoA N-acyltransferase n=1 Tax=Striga asiatica TaxID=4170 RepID=A0A5A7PDB4_STRAF|nr:acyl-CoA N-acyltransferase [Striga asiatica]